VEDDAGGGDLRGGTMSASSRRSSHGAVDRLTLYRRPHLLVAHGERIIRDGVAGILGRAGYDVDVAGDFDEALAILDKGEVDALVVSHRLPPDGCLALLDAYEDPPPTVVLDGHADDISKVLAQQSVRSVLTRPFPLQDFYDAVAEATRPGRSSETQPKGDGDG